MILKRSFKICFFINPVAGIGGEPGLKGSDYVDIKKLISEGYRFTSYDKARRFLESLDKDVFKNVIMITPQDPMGCSIVKSFQSIFQEVRCVSLEKELVDGLTTKDHTIEFVEKHSRECEIIVLVGGDGTARDVSEALKRSGHEDMLVLGIPAGVKVYSGIFAISPEMSAYVLTSYIKDEATVVKRPVIDADENSLREGSLNIRFFGELNTIFVQGLIQDIKSSTTYADLDYEGVAKYLDEIMSENKETLYLIGPGGTLKKIFEYLSIEKTAFGVDALYDKKIIGKDLSSKEIKDLVKKFEKIKIILTPIGGTKFLIGRGNQQITPEIWKRVSKENLIIVTSLSKIGKDYKLYIDTGDKNVDLMLKGFVKALIGYREEIIIRLVPSWLSE
jgi:predicted polyphosphate/ATP-dependent NAD kinase